VGAGWCSAVYGARRSVAGERMPEMEPHHLHGDVNDHLRLP